MWRIMKGESSTPFGVGNLMVNVWYQMTTKWSNFSIAPVKPGEMENKIRDNNHGSLKGFNTSIAAGETRDK